MTNQRKIRGEAPLDQLTAEQRKEVVAQCESTAIPAVVLWLKTQYNITLSRKTLVQWLDKHREHRSVTSRLDEIRQARDQAMLIGKVVGTAAEITEANIVLIAQAVFEELVKPPEHRDEDKLARYMSVALKVKDQDLKARTVDLAFERFHFDAAKKALAFATQLQGINERGIDDRAKIAEAMVLLFGEPVSVI